MRMRKRPNLAPRMEKCAELMINEPETMRGHWRELMPDCTELHIELGCGKGRFTAGTAAAAPNVELIAIEKVPDAMIIAMERVKNQELKNVRFISADVAGLREMFAPEDGVRRIYINFCDPWPKSRDAKHRLTSPNFLRIYADLLPMGGQIYFKTDNRPLFDWSLRQFESEGWELREVTNDLHCGGVRGVMTDYEAKFHEQGVKINRLVAVKTENTKDGSAGELPRLRNAALSDARGIDR